MVAHQKGCSRFVKFKTGAVALNELVRRPLNFQAGHLLNASGKRTIFSDHILISRKWCVSNIFDGGLLCF